MHHVQDTLYRPLIFIAHSFGGLVVLRVCRLSMCPWTKLKDTDSSQCLPR